MNTLGNRVKVETNSPLPREYQKRVIFNRWVAILVLCASFLNTLHADLGGIHSPKEYYEMIGNPQVDLADQGSAYRILKSESTLYGQRGNPEANYYLAECYVSGKTGDGGPDYARNSKGFPSHRPEAYKLALPLYENAAQFDHIPSLVKLSALFAVGNHVPKDLDKSLTYLIKAAKLGDKDSLKKILPLYSAGFPGVTDERQRFMGMEILADGGHPEAQIELSKWLISKDSKEAFDEAKLFLDSLAAKGNVSAVALLKEMESKVNAARAEAQKADALQIQETKKQDAAAQAARRESETQGGIFIIAAITILCFAILGTILGLMDKVVVFYGKSDLVISSVIAGLLLMALFFVYFGEDLSRIGVALGVLAAFLFLYSARNAYVANQKSIVKAMVVMPTKFILGGILVFLSVALIGGVKSGIESSTKAGQIGGYGADERKERRKHKQDAARNFKAAAFAAAVLYPLHKLIKMLVKEKPSPL